MQFCACLSCQRRLSVRKYNESKDSPSCMSKFQITLVCCDSSHCHINLFLLEFWCTFLCINRLCLSVITSSKISKAQTKALNIKYYYFSGLMVSVCQLNGFILMILNCLYKNLTKITQQQINFINIFTFPEEKQFVCQRPKTLFRILCLGSKRCFSRHKQPNLLGASQVNGLVKRASCAEIEC